MKSVRKPRDPLKPFWQLLRNVRRILLWSMGAAAAPIVAGFSSLTPPWPPDVVPMTALLQVVTIVLLYHYFPNPTAAVANRILSISAAFLCGASILYLVLLSQFTFTEPVSKLTFVKGLVCTRDALAVYPKLCPWLGDDQLIEAEWEASRLWTLWSITFIRVVLLASWLLSFGSLSCLLGSFFVFQAGSGKPKAR